MEEDSTMMRVKREEEIELDLGLSIGGGFKKWENLNQTKNEPVDGPKNCGFDTDLLIESKKEIEALRRQEAKRKRQEKQQKKRTYDNGGYGVNGFDKLDKKMWLKSLELETKEHELEIKEQELKKSKVEEEEEENSGIRSNNIMEMKNMNLNFTVDQNVVGFKSTVCPVMYPYPPGQYVQFANGFQYPCLNVMPCLAAAAGADVGNEQSMVQSMAGRSLTPESDQNTGDGCASDQNFRKAGSNGGSLSFSAVLDYRSSSHEGGGSCDTRSHSSHSLPEQLILHNSEVNETKGQSEHSASSHLRETAQVYDETTNCSANSCKPKTSSGNAQCSPSTRCTTNPVEQKFSSNAAVCRQTKPKEEAATELQQSSSHNPISTTKNLSPGVTKESKKDMGKPPKPQTRSQHIPPLPHMPCVSTTGQGPKGKTINGILYRYTKTEVSIICVCHGTSFSPAEFVQHAGGTDVSHPLRHITVIPPAF